MQREEEKRPIRIGMVGAGRYGAMFLAQSRFIPGMEVYGVADLNIWRRPGVFASVQGGRRNPSSFRIPRGLLMMKSGRDEVGLY